MKKTILSKEEFKKNVQDISKVEAFKISKVERDLADPTFLKHMEAMAEHDPELVRLCNVANEVHLAAMKNVVAYISKKVEN